MDIQIQTAKDSDSDAIREVILTAFGEKEGGEVAEVTFDLLKDPTAEPLLSLVAVADNNIVGHILFTATKVDGAEGVVSTILAPLSVHPDFHSKGIGGKLIEEGHRQLKEAGTQLVFVLGYPGYYTKFAFLPSGVRGFEAPYEIPAKDADAWMVLDLEPGTVEAHNGKVKCADALSDPRHWRE